MKNEQTFILGFSLYCKIPRYQITVNLAIPCIITQERQLNTDKLYIITAGITA